MAALNSLKQGIGGLPPHLRHRCGGQSLVELLIALALGVLVMLTAFAMIRFLVRLSSYDPIAQTGAFLARETAHGGTALAEGSWNAIASLPVGEHHIATSTAGFIVLSGTATSSMNGIVYTRSFTVSPVARDGADAIVSIGGTDDSATKKIKATVSWSYGGQTYSEAVERYVARTGSEVIVQTEWVGGSTCPGSDEPIPQGAVATRFCAVSSGTLDYSTMPGSVTIQGY